MRIMGLDVGSKTVGVAVSDPLGFTAQGLEIIPIDEEKGEFGFDRLTELVQEYKVDKFVVGLPIQVVRVSKQVKPMVVDWNSCFSFLLTIKMNA